MECFVGGANVIDKIKCVEKIGYDNNKYLIALLTEIQKDDTILPKQILIDEYEKVKKSYINETDEYSDWYKGLVGFCASFGSIFFKSYAKKHSKDFTGHKSSEAINNLEKQRPNLKNIDFKESCYTKIDLKNIKNAVIYCDPPYKNTVKYSKSNFDYEFFYKWCEEISKNNIVIVSGYEMPENFKKIWEKETRTLLSQKTKGDATKRLEKLFVVNGGYGT